LPPEIAHYPVGPKEKSPTLSLGNMSSVGSLGHLKLMGPVAATKHFCQTLSAAASEGSTIPYPSLLPFSGDDDLVDKREEVLKIALDKSISSACS
jgi:hypothetical protein